MAATVQESRYNLRTLAGRIAARLSVDPRSLSYDERRAYNAALAAEILKYPNGFTADVRNVAAHIVDQGPLADTAFAWGDFAADVTDNAIDAGSSVAGIGQGVLTTAKLSSWLIPLAVVVFVVLWLMRRPPPGPSLARA